MPKILLIYPATEFSKNYWTYWLPYSTLSIGSHLKNAGIEVTLFDGHVEDLSQITFSEYDVIGISCMIGNQLKQALEIAKNIKAESNIPVVLGGPFPTLAEEVAKTCYDFDYLIRGQGEIPMLKFVEALKDKLELTSVPSLTSNSFRTESMTPVSRDLCAPFDFSLVDVKRYFKNELHINDKTINYISSQGCPFDCAFCSDTNIYCNKWVSQNNSRTITDIKYLVDKGANGIKFYDSNFFVNPKRSIEFADSLLENNINIKWGAAIHPFTLLGFKDEDMAQLEKSGLSRVLIGLESPVQEILDLVGKGSILNKDSLIKTVKRCKKYNISGSYTMIVGFPGVPESHFDETLAFGEWIKEFDSNSEVKIHIYYPYPKTRMYSRAIEFGFIPKEDLDYYSNIDYYESKTPFSNPQMENKVRKFNERHSLSVRESK